MTESEKPDRTDNRAAGLGRGGIALRLVTGAVILLAVVWFARDATDEIKNLETWVAGLGVLAPVVFVGVAVILMSFFVPASLFSAVAGTLFGLGWGTVVMSAAALAGASVNYAMANYLFSNRISKVLERYPKLQSIQRAVVKKGWRLQFMVRLTPINAATVNYIFGSAGVPFSSYMLAALGMVPGLFVEVYFGHLAKHVAKSSASVSSHSTEHLVVMIGGFLACVALMIGIGHFGKRAIAKAEADVKAGDE
jgi:uncharacterized membrane protein YdjX (TVP38/TMEM64 family)